MGAPERVPWRWTPVFASRRVTRCWMRSWPSADSLQRSAATTGRTDESAFPGMVRGTKDRTGAYSARKAHAERAHVESFHGRLREECLAVSWFHNLFDARRKIAAWRKDHNEQRPHSSLGYRTPSKFAAQALAFYRAELGQEASNAGPSPQTPIPAETGDGTKEVCRILT